MITTAGPPRPPRRRTVRAATTVNGRRVALVLRLRRRRGGRWKIVRVRAVFSEPVKALGNVRIRAEWPVLPWGMSLYPSGQWQRTRHAPAKVGTAWTATASVIVPGEWSGFMRVGGTL